MPASGSTAMQQDAQQDAQQDVQEDDLEDDLRLRPRPFPNLISTVLLDRPVSVPGGRVNRRAPRGSADEARILSSGRALPKPQVARAFAPPAMGPMVCPIALDHEQEAAHQGGELRLPSPLRAIGLSRPPRSAPRGRGRWLPVRCGPARPPFPRCRLRPGCGLEGRPGRNAGAEAGRTGLAAWSSLCPGVVPGNGRRGLSTLAATPAGGPGASALTTVGVAVSANSGKPASRK